MPSHPAPTCTTPSAKDRLALQQCRCHRHTSNHPISAAPPVISDIAKHLDVYLILEQRSLKNKDAPSSSRERAYVHYQHSSFARGGKKKNCANNQIFWSSKCISRSSVFFTLTLVLTMWNAASQPIFLYPIILIFFFFFFFSKNE